MTLTLAETLKFAGDFIEGCQDHYGATFGRDVLKKIDAALSDPPSPSVSAPARVGSEEDQTSPMTRGPETFFDTSLVMSVADIIRDVCDLDYTSPDDQPDLLQVTTGELTAILENRLTALRSSAGTRSEEEPQNMDTEADAFALELLTPTQFLIKAIRKMDGISIDDDEKMDRLARKFKVSRQRLAQRILTLDDELRDWNKQ